MQLLDRHRFEGKRLLCPIAMCIVIGCGGSDNSPPASSGSSSPSNPPTLTCALGELNGAWRLHFEQRSGSCPSLPDETYIPGGLLTPFAATVVGWAGLSGCQTEARALSPDKCRVDTTIACPDESGGTIRARGIALQVRPERIEAQVFSDWQSTRYGNCRADYNVTATRL